MSTERKTAYEYQVTVCKHKNKELYSLRNQGHLFWTGLEDDRWVSESVAGTDNDYIFEIEDKKLVYAIKSLLEYSLEHGLPMQLVINEL